MRSLIHRKSYRKCLSGSAALAFAATLGIPSVPAVAADSSPIPSDVGNLRQMFTEGEVDGSLRTAYYSAKNAYFVDEDHNTAAIGGMLGFTTATLDGFSLRLNAFAQRNYARSHAFTRDLGPDVNALGEAYLQWEGYDFQIRAGDQELTEVPFTSTYDYRILPQSYQGVKVRYGSDKNHLTAMRMFRYKSRIDDNFHRKTNYNLSFNEPFMPGTNHEGFNDQKTSGFWAVGGVGDTDAGPANLSGSAWYINYRDYANMYYADGKVARAEGSIRPFFAVQWARETDTGDALIGEIDSHVYGAQLGLKHNSIKATLNYDYIPHRNGTYLNGALATPYATNEASGPLFAQPYLTSTQDLGSGNAFSAEVTGSPTNSTLLGARYSFMDLKAPDEYSDDRSIAQSEYLLYGSYNFHGALEGFSITDFMAYQRQNHRVQGDGKRGFWENRLSLAYNF